MGDNESILVLLARMEGKLDTVLHTHETLRMRVDDHEARLRAQEAKPSVSPKFLWSSLLGGIAVMISLLQFFDYVRGI